MARRRRRGRGRGGNSVRGFLRPHTGRQAGRVARAYAGAEYNPGIRQLRQEARASRGRERQIGQGYAQLARDYAQSQRQGTKAFETAQEAVAKQLAEASKRSQGQMQELASEDEEFAKLVGGPKNTQGLSEIAKAGSAAERNRVALNAPVAQEQANYLASLGQRRTAARMRGFEARASERNRRGRILEDFAATRKERGAAAVGHKERLREADRGYTNELSQLKIARREAKTAEEAMRLDYEIARMEAERRARADQVAARQGQQEIGIARGQLGVSAREARSAGRSGGRTQAQIRSDRRTGRDASAATKRIVRQLGGLNSIKSPQEWNELEELVTEEEGVNPAVARQVVNRLRKRGEAAETKQQRRRVYNRRNPKPRTAWRP